MYTYAVPAVFQMCFERSNLSVSQHFVVAVTPVLQAAATVTGKVSAPERKLMSPQPTSRKLSQSGGMKRSKGKMENGFKWTMKCEEKTQSSGIVLCCLCEIPEFYALFNGSDSMSTWGGGG